MKLNIFLLIVSFFLTIEVGYAQCNQGDVVTFQKTFGGTTNERAHSIQSTLDGGYIVVGETTSFGAGGKDWFVMKLDANGNQQWTKTIGGSGDDDGFSITIKQTSDLGYIISGSTNSFGAGSFDDSYLIKLSSIGNIVWEKRITGGSWDRLRDVVELVNGDFLFTGSAGSFSNGNMDVHLVKISPTGNLIWINNLGTSVREHSQSLLELPGGNYITSGNTNVTDTRNAFLIKTDNNGQPIWSKEYGVNSKQDDFNETILLNDGNLLNVGWTKPNDYNIWLMKSDTNGNVIWNRTYGGSGDDIGVNVREKSNGELVISSFTDSYGNGKEMLLINTDNLGGVIWSKTYGGIGNDEMESWGKPMALSGVDEIIIAGGTYSYGVGGEDIYIVKTNECGESYCNEQDVVLTLTSPNINGVDFSISSVTGGTLVATNSTVNSINFTEVFLCIDSNTISVACDLTANFFNTSFCFGDSTYFNDLSIDNVGNIVNWQWYFGDGDSLVGVQNPSHYYNLPGNYNVILSVTNDSNCVDSITIPLTINPVYSLITSISICQGDSILLEGVFQKTAGIYNDSLQSITGCDSLITTTLTIDPVFISIQNETICEGDSVLFRGAFYKLAGSYTDSLQTVLGCDSLFSLNLTVNPFYLINEYQTICYGESFLFGGVYYHFSGNYTNSVQTIGGCDSSVILNLTVNLPVETFDSKSICEGDSILLGGNYQSQPGSFVDSLMNSIGCDSIVNTILTEEILPNVIAFSDTTINKGTSAQLSVFGADSYFWSPNYEINCNSCQFPNVFPQTTTTYIVEGNYGVCSSSDTITVTVMDVEQYLYIPNSFSPNGDGVNDSFRIYGQEIDEFKILIFNRWGELLFESNNIGNNWNGFYKGKEVPSGVYVFRINVVSSGFGNIKKTGHINLVR